MSCVLWQKVVISKNLEVRECELLELEDKLKAREQAVIWVNHLTCMTTVVGDLRHDTFEKKIVLNGDVYFGDVKGRIPHGRCKYTWSYGTVYEGGWEEGKMTALRTSLKAIKAMLNLQLGIRKTLFKDIGNVFGLGVTLEAKFQSIFRGAQATKFLQLCRFDKNCSMTFQQQRCNNDINKHFHEPLTYEHGINKKKFKLNATSSDNPQSDATYNLIKPQKVCYRFLGCSI
ncbi:phosphatidylinositol-4-phosphate 5-kinase [Artemisia annua]|uniref:Phosphatidylinositol-4-phosphate 5-kinase n=1 Tax=Artemisia annua TaxID=35608 RepID=A0A2U1MSL9_ARTAN|nr:phosphatidylinositol-4-phosphate 5-kinase [Artemisia annua]